MKIHKDIIWVTFFILFLWGISYIFSKNTPHDPLEIHLNERLSPPSIHHICGTDELGRDIFSRICLGFSNTVRVSIMCFLSSFIIGVMLGTLVGIFYDSTIDKLFNWISILLFSLPFLLVVSALMSVTNKSLFNAYLIITALIWVSPARIIRAGIVRAKSAKFILAERAFGKSEWNIIIRGLIPLSIGPAFTFSFRFFPEIIGMEAGLSFLGLGIQPPNPGLGKMIFDSIGYLHSAWWYAFFPSLTIFILVIGSNLLYLKASRTRALIS